MARTGKKNQALVTGRITYGHDGTDAYPIGVDSSRNVQALLVAGTAAAGTVAVSSTKTVATELLAVTNVAASTQQKSSVLDLTGVKRAVVFIDHGRTSSANFGTQGTEYRVEISEQAAGNDTWRSLATLTCASTACLAVAASADVAAAGTTVVVTSGTSIAARGDIVFWANTVSAGSSEWMRVISVSGTVSFVILDGLRYGQDSDTNIFTKAEHFVVTIDTAPYTRLRAVVNNNASGTTLGIYSRVAAITEK